MKHGSRSTYTNRACRCDACCTAERRYQKSYNGRVGWVREPPGPPIRHGTLGGYTNRGCRCDACQSAMREYNQARRKTLNECARECRAAYAAASRKGGLRTSNR